MHRLRLAFCAAIVSLTSCGGGGAAATPGGMTPPSFRIEADAPSTAVVSEYFEFAVRAIDPNGSAVTLVLLDPPLGLSCAPATGVGTASAHVRWDIAKDLPSVCRLTFVARRLDGAALRHVVSVDIIGSGARQGTVTCDVTGDGIPDLIAAAPRANQDGHDDVGAVYVWAGGDLGTAPIATLVPAISADATMRDLALGELGIVCCDWNGDGVLDILARPLPPSQQDSSRAQQAAAPVPGSSAMTGTGHDGIFVWLGGAQLSGVVAPTARLRAPAGDELESDTPLMCRDVTGDGIVDVVATQQGTSTFSEGVVLVWAGERTPSGDRTPTATLRPADGPPGWISFGTSNTQGIYCADVTNDGVRDVVVASGLATIDGLFGAGDVSVFIGGPSLSGVRTPDVSLRPPPTRNAHFGHELLRFCDVTGDGRTDVLVATPDAEVAGEDQAGALYVFLIGATPAGVITPHATLTIPNASDDDQLTSAADGPAFVCQDVTGDGQLDIVTRADHVDLDEINQGAGFVWAGGASLVGTPPPTATLVWDSPQEGDKLGRDALRCADVTGDGVLDVVLASEALDLERGGIAVYAGGATLVGLHTPTAALQVAGSLSGDLWSRSLVRCVDMTGDGTLDIVTSTDAAGPAVNGGALAMWSGGPGLQGAVAETALFRLASPNAGDLLGRRWSCVDLSGDGVADLVAVSFSFDAAASNAGALFVWLGSNALSGPLPPHAVLAVPSAQADDRLGDTSIVFRADVAFGDVTGDGVLDVIACAASADVGGSTDAGALYLWSGAVIAANGGLRAPSALLIDPRPGNHSEQGLGASDTQHFGLVDHTGDGVLDVFGGAAGYATNGGPAETGAILTWSGGATLTANPGAPAEPTVLHNPTANPGDRLTDIDETEAE